MVSSLWLGILLFLLLGVPYSLWKYVRVRSVQNTLSNIRGPAPQSYERGNLKQLMHRDGWAFQKSLEQYGSVARLHGAFGANMLYVFDPTALYHIVVKDHHIFEKSMNSLTSNMVVFGPNVLSTAGETHRKQRKLLSPVFSPAHLRNILPIFYKVTEKLRKAVAKEVENGASEIDILGWMGRTALELIGQGGLGYSFDPLTEDIPNPFGDAMKSLPATLWLIPSFRQFAPLVTRATSFKVCRYLLRWVPGEGARRLSSIIDVMQTTSEGIFDAKRKALAQGDEVLAQQVGEGKDLMSILLKANIAASEGERLPDDELIGQMSILIFAATDTTSASLARIIYLLAEHPDVQEKLREEIRAAGDDGELSYEQLVDLPFMDAICRETLRLYPPVSMISREAHQTHVLPLSEPIRGVDGNMVSEIVVPKGTTIQIGILACNTNKSLWGEDALEWKPERWLAPLPNALTRAQIPGVYSHLMTFVGGGRSCIGFKFSQLEMKVVLAVLLTHFIFEKSDKPIAWNLAGVSYPTVRGDGDKAQLPVKVRVFRK